MVEIFVIFLPSNIQMMKQGISNRFGAALKNSITGIVYIIIGLVYAWKLTLLLLVILPLISICGALIFTLSKKYKEKELQAYEAAGEIAQNVLTSIKTVSAFNLQKKFLGMYKANLKQAQSTTSMKGLVFGFLIGSVEALMLTMFAIVILFSTYLIQNECQVFNYGGIFTAGISTVQSFIFLANALSYLNNLSQGLVI
jgi:ABC-type bacteriocin/lantibiotic exporter with double-glycine peptidase domain